MLSEELLRRVRQIEITTRRMVDDMMSGSYRSQFKGHGVQFSEHRLYMPGDDVRHIDWKVSARSREPLLKKFEEERELNVFLVVDISASEGFGSSRKLKSEIVAEVGGMLAYAASHTGDKVGVLLFAGEIEKIIHPGKGRTHVQRIIRDLLGHESRSRGTDLARALDAAGRIMKHSGVIFVLSDFIAQGYETSLKRLARKHDVIAISIRDAREHEVPDLGKLRLLDPETGTERVVDTSSYAFKQWLKEFQVKREAGIESVVRSGKVEELRIFTKDDYGQAVVRFFEARSRRKKR